MAKKAAANVGQASHLSPKSEKNETGSFYYHCDWHASHYVKVMLDQIFSKKKIKDEIVWKRTGSHYELESYS